MFAPLVLAAVITTPPCWTIFDGALQHSAASSHPQFVSYDERIFVSQDDQRLVQSTAHIDYRDDGLALVRDERFDFQPILTRHTEPGPPELGPYGNERDTWLPGRDVLPTIASVRAEGDLSCTVGDVEQYKGHSTYHLLFGGSMRNRPTLKALWVDTASRVIWKVIVSGFVRFDDDPYGEHPLADFEVELGVVDRYLVVNHVVWAYQRHVYSQTSDYFGEYTLTGYQFPAKLPDTYFKSTADAWK